MLEAKDQRHRRQFSPKKRFSKKFLLVPALRSWGFCVQAYADDLAVLVTVPDVLWIRGIYRNFTVIYRNVFTVIYRNNFFITQKKKKKK